MIAPETLYFPYTDINRDRLYQALLFFKKIILYRLPQDQLEDYLYLAEQRGLVRIEEVSFIEDPAEIKQILAEMTQWLNQHPDRSYLSVLHQRALDIEVEEIPSRLASNIRQYQSVKSSKKDSARDAQIFLHFARYLQIQADEINELMRNLDRKEERLDDLLGVDKSERLETVGKAIEEDPGLELVNRRLVAWGHFYSVHETSGLPLFSDRFEVIDELDQALARTKPRSYLNIDRQTETLEPVLEVYLPLPAGPISIDDIEAYRGELEGRLDSEWFDLAASLSTKVLTREELPELRRSFSTMAQDSKLNAPPAAGEPGLALYGYLIPGANLKTAYLEAVGLAPMEEEETEVFCGPIFEVRQIPV
ncbi:MAG: hypothetical protein JRG97_09670 [Deltaproteobacteria bacterium]|nr:hypothetical protein [Deltaproteobacteria bacterium]MBW2051646.1 hypothetical protein [Deltaproteobacteria bacterium]MBW2141323.1 hypothetical protein [Deltaproteobacteria bacterium]MBW2322399.1 hypothetical protein [Deltaproteobacteria bacterium]